MAHPELALEIAVPRKYNLRRTLGGLRMGGRDPAFRAAGSALAFCFRTPEGPVTVELGHRSEVVEARLWGPGSAWVRPHLDALVGLNDRPDAFRPSHPALIRAHQRSGGLHLPRLPRIFDRVVQVVALQLIRSTEGQRAWRRIVWDFGEPAPGPQGLLLPPAPTTLAGLSDAAFVAHGLPHKQARTVLRVAEAAEAIEAAAAEGVEAVSQVLLSIRGVGPWTVGYVCGTALGHADALLPGDYHLPDAIAWMLAGEPKGDDARMFELLQPFEGHRFRVVKLVWASGATRARKRPRGPDRPLGAWRDRETR